MKAKQILWAGALIGACYFLMSRSAERDVTMPAKPPRVPQIVEQEIAPKAIKQAHQHQHYL
jgi:hypothetical protein